MERTKTNRALHALTLILLSAFLYCCADEHDGFNGPSNGKEKTVTFSVRVPGTSTPPTRALGDGDENEVKQIAVLLFTDGKYVYQPIYSNSISSSTDGKIKNFTIRVPEGIYDMVILANSNASLNSIKNDIQVGDAKADVLKQLVLTNEGKWNAKPGSDNYKAIPMWGEMQNITVASGMPKVEATLLRMLAKIDVNLSSGAKGNLNLTSVQLYNYNSKGQIVPNAEAWDNANNIVTAPSVAGTLTKGPLVYKDEEITKDTATTNLGRGVSCTNEIYAFEALKGTETLANNTCIVIGGKYKDDANETFYRIDFANTTEGVTKYLALLRNNHYKISVQSVSGPGLATADLAFNSRPVNIKANIIQWSDGKFTEFDINDQYMVGVSQGAFTFSKEPTSETSSDNILSIITDYPGGWQITVTGEEGSTSDTSWLHCTTTESKDPKGTDTRLILQENKTGNERVAYINIKAERLNYKVKVTQSNTFTVGVHITGSDYKEISLMEFVSTQTEVEGGTPPPAQKFNLNWSPKERELFYVSSQIGPGFEFNTGSGLNQLDGQGSITGGSVEYTIQPKPISKDILDADPFYQRTSVYLYTISDGITTVNKSLTLRQYAYNMKAYPDAVYLMDGGKDKSFSVRSNSPFTATIEANPDNVVSNLRTSGAPNVSDKGTPVLFDIKDDLTNPSIYQSKVTVRIHSPKGLFEDKLVELNCGSGIKQPSANSYILHPNSIGVLIPVSRCNDCKFLPYNLQQQLGADESFTAELLWTDNKNGIGSNSNIRAVSAIGTGTSGYVFVIAGSAPGNAVVAIKNKAGKILWSWHIWVVSDTPQVSGSANLMDRCLGALSATGDGVQNLGLLYQWGRKDPFTNTIDVTSTDGQPRYDAEGNVLKFEVKGLEGTSYSTKYNYPYALANPTIFYSNKASSGADWYSNESQSDKDKSFWGWNDKKTMNDPCPYGWRVPNTAELWQDNATYNWDTTGLSHGITSTKYGGYYPFTAYRKGSDGTFIRNDPSGVGSIFWTARLYDDLPNSFRKTKTGIAVNDTSPRASGVSIRCVKYDSEK